MELARTDLKLGYDRTVLANADTDLPSLGNLSVGSAPILTCGFPSIV